MKEKLRIKWIVIPLLLVMVFIYLNWNSILYKEIGSFNDENRFVIYKQNRFTKEYHFEVLTPDIRYQRILEEKGVE